MLLHVPRKRFAPTPRYLFTSSRETMMASLSLQRLLLAFLYCLFGHNLLGLTLEMDKDNASF